MEHVVTLWLGNICQDSNFLFLSRLFDRRYTVWQYFSHAQKFDPYDWVDIKSGLIHVYVVVTVNFLFPVIFIFPLFLGMVMYANEFKTKEKQKLREIKKLTATYKHSVLADNATKQI